MIGVTIHDPVSAHVDLAPMGVHTRLIEIDTRTPWGQAVLRVAAAQPTTMRNAVAVGPGAPQVLLDSLKADITQRLHWAAMEAKASLVAVARPRDLRDSVGWVEVSGLAVPLSELVIQ